MGLITAFVVWLIKYIIQRACDFISMNNQGFNLTGCWYAEHGSYVNESINAIEVIYIWQRGEKIKYRMEQYANFEDVKRIYVGNGIIKAGICSSYYYPIDKVSKLIGCMNFQVKTKSAAEIYLSGTFYEVDERKKDFDFQNYPDDYYKMYRMQIDIKRKLRLMYWRNVFQSFREVSKYIEQYK